MLYNFILVQYQVKRLGKEGAPIPTTFWDYIKSWGPGIAFVLAIAGAGDVVDCTAAGASYGFALLWTLTLALLLRGVVVSILAKYELCNVNRETILAGYRRLGKWVPIFVAIVLIVYCLIYGAFLLPAAGAGLWHLLGEVGGDWGRFAITFVLMVIAVLIWAHWGRGVYRIVEYLFKVTLLLMAVMFIGVAALTLTASDVAEMLISAVTPRIPPGVGPWEASFLAVAAIGAIGGSVANFLYPYFIKGKGWADERYLKVQRFDLWLSIIVILILDAAIWAVGAKVLHPRGIHVESVTDLALSLGLVVGSIGMYLVYAGFFVTAYDTYIGVIVGQTMAAIDALHQVFKERKEKYGTYLNDPLYRIALYILLAVAVIWALPGMPGVIYLVILGNALSVIAVPLISIGLLILTNKTEIMGKYKNKWWENLLLIVVTLIALWATYTLIRSLLKI